MVSTKTLSTHFVTLAFYLIVLHVSVSFSMDNPVCWIFNYVPYSIKPGFSTYERNFIKQEIAKINDQTCVYWGDMEESENIQINTTYFVIFKKWSNKLCETEIHYPLKVVIRLGDYCFETGDVLHEILHAMGFDHEHKRIDRDCYVIVSEAANKYYDFKISYDTILNIDKFPYDKQSIMHYRRSSSIKARSERFYQWEPLGKMEGTLSDLDLWKIQYRFCGRPHYCEVYPEHCQLMDKMESEMKCIDKKYLT